MCRNMASKKVYQKETQHFFIMKKKHIYLGKYAKMLKSYKISNTTEYFGFSICHLKPQHFLKGIVPIQKTSEQKFE